MTDGILSAADIATGVTAIPAANTTAQSTFDEQYSTFLELLTTQLRNQNPAEPMNTNEFTQQVVSYSSLEQQINTNSQIENLVSMISSFLNGNAISYVGDIVSFGGAAGDLENGQARWDYNVGQNGVSGTIEIRDSAGQVIRTDTANPTAGRPSYVWDGRTDSGDRAPDGRYAISVVVRDGNDAAISVDTSVSGKVEAVDLTGSSPKLIVGDRSIDVSDILTVRSGS